MPLRRAASLALLSVLLISALAATLWPASARQEDLARRMAGIQPALGQTAVDCAEWRTARPLVLLVLGQSNAANHAEAGPAAAPPLALWHAGHCYRAQAPLPGATGRGDSLWPWVNQALGSQLAGRPLLFVVLAVESSSVAEWTEDSTLHRYWQQQLRALQASQLKVDLVLWQQGEADSRAATSASQYRQGMETLRSQLDKAGVGAPLMLARSSYCPPAAHQPIHAVQTALGQQGSGFVAGPDTDALQGPLRSGGCHFSRAGLAAAAARWADSLDDWARMYQDTATGRAAH